MFTGITNQKQTLKTKKNTTKPSWDSESRWKLLQVPLDIICLKCCKHKNIFRFRNSSLPYKRLAKPWNAPVCKNVQYMWPMSHFVQLTKCHFENAHTKMVLFLAKIQFGQMKIKSDLFGSRLHSFQPCGASSQFRKIEINAPINTIIIIR